MYRYFTSELVVEVTDLIAVELCHLPTLFYMSNRKGHTWKNKSTNQLAPTLSNHLPRKNIGLKDWTWTCIVAMAHACLKFSDYQVLGLPKGWNLTLTATFAGVPNPRQSGQATGGCFQMVAMARSCPLCQWICLQYCFIQRPHEYCDGIHGWLLHAQSIEHIKRNQSQQCQYALNARTNRCDLRRIRCESAIY